MNRTLKYVSMNYNVWIFWGELPEGSETIEWVAASEEVTCSFQTHNRKDFENLSDWQLHDQLILTTLSWVSGGVLTEDQKAELAAFETKVSDERRADEQPMPSYEHRWPVPGSSFEEVLTEGLVWD